MNLRFLSSFLIFDHLVYMSFKSTFDIDLYENNGIMKVLVLTVIRNTGEDNKILKHDIFKLIRTINCFYYLTA